MKGILNILTFLNENWFTILAIIGAIVAIVGKTVQFLRLSKEQRKAFVTNQIAGMVLHLVTEAEALYGSKTGEIKKSYVMEKIYASIPQLKDLISQEELTKFVDKAIDAALEKIKEIATQKEVTPDALGAKNGSVYIQNNYIKPDDTTTSEN